MARTFGMPSSPILYPEEPNLLRKASAPIQDGLQMGALLEGESGGVKRICYQERAKITLSVPPGDVGRRTGWIVLPACGSGTLLHARVARACG